MIVTRYVDKLRDKEKRRLDVFRALMRTRKMPLNPDHVGALNLVEVEFHDQKKVMAALKELLEHFDQGYGANKTVDELRAANDKSDILRTSLLSTMADSLGYKFEQLEIHRGGYTPQGWGIELDEQMTARRGLAELLSGRRTLPISVVPAAENIVAASQQQQQQQQPQIFPPKPE